MRHDPQGEWTQDEWTTHVLNIHGVFFERRCATLVTGIKGWRVIAVNYPIEFPHRVVLGAERKAISIYGRVETATPTALWTP